MGSVGRANCIALFPSLFLRGLEPCVSSQQRESLASLTATDYVGTHTWEEEQNSGKRIKEASSYCVIFEL